MARKQTRRSISVNRQLFEQAKAIAAVEGVPLSQFAEKALREHIENTDPRRHAVTP